MFREMRRKDRLLSKEEAEQILMKATNGVLALQGDDDYPYGVPVSFAYDSGHIYFHCFKEGYKLDCIRRNPKVSFTVVTNDEIQPADFGTLYESVICFGTARILEADEETLKTHMHIIRKYSADFEKEGIEYYRRAMKAMVMVDITLEHMTGKAHR